MGLPVSSSPVNPHRLRYVLQHHPNRNVVEYLYNGLVNGFDIGYRGPILDGVTKNLKSASAHPEEVTSILNKEVQRGHTLGPFAVKPFSNLQISPLGTIPKKDGSLRLILDLSSPRGLSVNDGIDRDEFSTSYSSFDEAVDLVRSLGPGSYMAKIDIKHAFRLCPVRVADFYLLGMFWQGNYFIDTRLPFGSRSSPYIFNTLAKALCWAIIHVCNILGVLHYLDDFFLASSSQSSCQRDFDTILNFFRFLGVPISEDKLVSPSTLLVGPTSQR